MAFVTFTCAHCGLTALMQSGAYNRAQKAGLRVYCDRACSGLGRRKHKSAEQKKAEKSAYDAQRRIDLRDRIKAEKAAYHKRTYDPVKAAEERKVRMPRHVEYCRRPEYRAWKSKYDAAYRAKKDFGPFWESALLVNDLSTEVLSRQTRYEIDLENGKLNKRNNRRRDYDRQINVPEAFRR